MRNLSPLSLLVLTACGGGTSTISTLLTSASGKVIKGPLNNALVGLDYDGDGVVDSATVRTDANGAYSISTSQKTYTVIAVTDESTVDTSSGTVLSGVTLKAPEGATVITPTTTLMKEGNLTAEQVASVLGLPDGVDPLTFNPFADGVSASDALAVEKASQQVMSVVNAFASAAEGAGATEAAAYTAALNSIVEVVKTKAASSETLDLTSTADLALIKTQAKTEMASTAGVNTTAFNALADDTATAVENVNTKIDSITDTDLTSDASKNIFSTTQVLADQVKTAAIAEVSSSGTGNITFTDASVVNTAASNKAPTNITLSKNAISEAASSLVIGTLTTADSDQTTGVKFKYALAEITGSDYAAFSINQSTGELSLKAQPDYETKSSYSVTILSTDEGGKTFSKSFTVSITDANDAPTVANAIPNQTIAEDSALSFQFNSNVFADVDAGDSFTYTATLSDDSALPSWLSFDADTRTFSGTPLNANVGAIDVKVTATDSGSAAITDTFSITVTNTNDAPTVANAIPNQTIAEDSALSFQFNSNVFADVDVGDSFTYTATLSDGSDLPSWLSFNASTRTFSGTPLNANVGVLAVKVTATDGSSATVADTFNITVTNTNDAPTVANAIPNQTIAEDSALNFQFNSNVFADVDAGDSFTYTATLSDDSALPSWLSFDADTRTFSGTPLNANVGAIDVKVTATDSGSAAITDTFSITVTNTNDAPTVANAIADQAATEDSAFSYQFASNVFADVDVGDSFTYTATLSDDSALPSWLSFDADTRTFSGTPLNANVGVLAVKVTATDGSSATGSDTFNITVANTNDAPSITSSEVTSVNEDTAYSYTFEASDVDSGDTVTLAATRIPSWLSFNSGTGVLSGTPRNSDVGDHSIVLNATDNAGVVRYQEFEINVINTNDAPTVANVISDQAATEDSAFSYQFASNVFADVDVGDSFTYTATLSDDSALPSWLSFNASTRTFSGTPLNANVGVLAVKVTATDGSSATVADTFNITVTNTNDAPTVANAIPNQTIAEDSALNFQFNSNVFADVDAGDSFTYTATLSDDSALPSWLSFDADTRTFSGTPLNANVGAIDVKVTATDSGSAAITDTFSITVTNTNDAPTVANAIPNQTIAEDSALSFQFNSNVFADVDVGDSFTYTATLSDGSDLPSWLSFNASTRTFSGTPLNANVGAIDVKVTATDSGSAAITDTFSITVTNTNDAPTVANAIANQAATEDSAFSYQFASNVFADVDVGDSFTYTATLSDDSALPSWLSFDADTRTFSGTPLNANVGVLAVKVTATDGSSATVADTFNITVTNTNDAPTVANAIPNQTIAEDSALNFQFNSNVFADVDAGDSFTYTATLSDDSALPSWLSFDADTRTFSGTPLNANVGAIDVKVTATDSGSAAITDTFSITVTNTNDAPTVANAIPNQTIAEDSALSFQFNSNVFADVDVGDSFTYTATLSDGSDLPSWLSFNASTRTFSGTPLNANVGAIDVKVTATDSGSAAITDTFSITVTNTNDAPTVANAIANQAATEDSAFSYQFASNVFADVDVGDSFTYTATLSDGSDLPSWLSFNASTRTFSGTPLNANVGVLAVKVTATDGSSATVADTFSITVTNTNDAPTVANAIADQAATEDSAFSYQFASNVFADVDVGDSFTYTATLSDDSALPSWLSFDADTRTFSGTPLNANVGAIDVKVTATDSGSAAITDTFSITVTNTNDAPTVANAIPNQTIAEDSALSFQFNSNVFADVDVGDSFTYTATLSDGSDLPSWLSFNASTRTFSGTPLNANVGVLAVKVTATDGSSATVADTFNITVTNTNDAPTVANAIPNQTIAEDSALNFQFNSNVFADVDAGDSFTYTATLSDDSALPSWLSFDADTRTFSGTPLNANVGAIDVKVTATDSGSAAITDTFSITVTNTNDAPTVANAIPNQTIAEDSALSFQFNSNVFADVDVGDSFTYTATLSDGSDLPSWLSFNASTRTFSGTPLNANVGAIDVKVTATDSGSAAITDTFSITVTNTNDAPTVANAIADQAATEDSAFSYQFASNVFADVDVGDSFTYTATLSDGSALPSWLSFDADTRTFSGTPLNANVGVLAVKVTATDGSSATGSDTFNITVANTNDAPTVANAIADQAATEDSAFSYQFASDVFADVDAGDSFTYTATLSDDSALPSWLSFDADTRTFSGTPLNANVGAIDVKVTATDSGSAAITDTFSITVTNTNDAPTVANAIPNQTIAEDSALSFQFNSNVFADVDVGDSFTYTATLSDGSDLPSWLSFNASTRTFSGTPLNANVGAIDVKVTATDSGSAAITDTFSITVTNTNDAPTVANAIADQAATEDSAFSYQFASNVFADVDVGDSFTYTATLSDGSALPSWLSFDADTRTFSGTPLNANVGVLAVKVTATDGSSATGSDTFNITVANTNDAPTVANAIADQAATEDSAFSYQFASDVFADVDVGDSFTYTATLSDDSALPSWLSFDASTRTFSGTPLNANVGAIDVKVTATDSGSAAITDTFALSVSFNPAFKLSDIQRDSDNDGFVINGVSADDWSGFSVSSAGDVNGDGLDDIIIGARKDDPNGESSGASFVVFGKSNGTGVELSNVQVGTAGFVINGASDSDWSGYSVSGAGDVNGDGLDDLIVGAPFEASGDTMSGSSYVVFGKSNSTAVELSDIESGGNGGIFLGGYGSNLHFGHSVSIAGDVNGDGFDDIIVGSEEANTSIVVFGGNISGTLGLASISSNNNTGGFAINGVSVDDYSGYSVSGAGDINGDGLDDLIVGAWKDDPNGSNSGASFVIFGKSTGTAVELSDVQAGTGGFVINGVSSDDRSGRSVSDAGDVNGDGLDDIIIGAMRDDPNGSNSGASFVVFGKSSGTAVELSAVETGTGGFVINGVSTDDNSGDSVSSAGDVNGDGFDDLIVGARGDDPNGSNSGASFVVFGKSSGTAVELSAVETGTGGFVINGVSADDYSGHSVSSAGDVNGDGFDDLIVGARGDDPNGSNSGASFVVFGGNFTNAATQVGTTGNDTLTGSNGNDIMIAGIGDDILIGAGGSDILRGGAGSDILAISDIGFLNIEGGSGMDTLRLDGTAVSLDLRTLSDNTITEIEKINLSGNGNSVALDALEVLRISDSSNSLRILGTETNKVTIDGIAWIKGVSVTDSEGTFDVYSFGQAILQIQQGVTLVGGPVSAVELSAVEAGNGGFVINGVSSSDTSGHSVSSAGDVNGDGLDDVIIGAKGVSNARGASYVVFGKSSSTAVELSAIEAGTGGFVINGVSSFDRSGQSVSSAGDVNGDGLDDLIVGAAMDDPNGGQSGASFVVFGKSSGTAVELSAVETGTGGFVINGGNANDSSGYSVSGAGDVNGDGLDDLIVGVPHDDPNGSSSGASYVVFGKSNGTEVELSAVEAGTGGFVINGLSTGGTGDRSGWSVSSAGDVNGDGLDDLIVGSPHMTNNSNSGASYVVFGKSTGTAVDLSAVESGTGGFVINGVSAGDRVGLSVSNAGDVNGDGFDDLIVGAPYDDPNGSYSGASFVVFGKSTGTAVELSDVQAGTGGFVINGVSADDYSGHSVSSAGDVNGDGFDDLIVGARRDDPNGSNSGASFVVFGKSSGAAIELSAVESGTGGFVINGVSTDDNSGDSVSSAGDVNGDGFDDLVIGAPYDDPNGSFSGASFIVFGGNFTSAATQVGTTGNDTLTGSAGGDFIFAGTGADTINGTAGVDRVSGGNGADVFNITTDTETMKIIDFSQTENDQIDLSAFNIADFATLKGNIAASGQGNHDTKITLDANTFVFLENFDDDILVSGDFIL